MNKKTDYLKRNNEIEHICQVLMGLQNNKTGAVFAIDGKWGYGKTFFLELLMEKLADMPETQDDIILYYDCWKYNYYDEPVIPIMSILRDGFQEIENSLEFIKQSDVMSGAMENLKKSMGEYAGHIVESKLGFNPYQIYIDSKNAGEDKRKNDNLFDEKYQVRTTLESVREKLSKVAQQHSIIFIVDELDRCLPEYSIKVLENIHHFFSDIDNVIIILAIDKKELEYTIRKIYGEHTDVERYLKKIIDFYIALNIGNLDIDSIYKYPEFISRFTGTKNDLMWTKQNLYYAMHDLDIRIQEKIWKKAILIHNLVVKEERVDYSCLFFEIFLLISQYYKKFSEQIENSGSFKTFYQTICLPDDSYKKIRRNSDTFFQLENKIQDRVKWYLTKAVDQESGEYCGEYYFKEYELWESETKQMIQFYSYSAIIS